jgi:hypothetical protein
VVVQRQALGAADDSDAVPLEHDPVAVDALVGVLSDEEIVRTLGDQGADHLPMRRRQILPLVDQDVIGLLSLALRCAAATAAASAKSRVPSLPGEP